MERKRVQSRAQRNNRVRCANAHGVRVQDPRKEQQRRKHGVINLFTTLEDDLTDVCYRMIEGALRGLRFRKQASVVTCVVPKLYGVPESSRSSDGEIELTSAYALQKEHDRNIRVFPMDVRVEDGKTIHGTSRCVAVVGIGNNMNEARGHSLRAVRRIRGELRHRMDIASEADIFRSCGHMKELRANSVGDDS